ncbi:NADH-quinone oxidoreductase subunit M [Sulfurospirillum deleyianum]|uniref:Proton-translocating NADH-quinone oxidoreductase, chain M n=1 Tax=Sulfurospirillum deleyianum (strain ATCC 51133 / DSM 6946 / 5175) TaxID=525898 RepID=D1AZ50_SULD5|nr:NADH-quinone oxidoreductase subunit M [Sulfurospirillum deleyianum]ACZ11188.1 proton-translocating NADH-quinone oxidoreductase, chain M [Sulfurospirillum deleyianum DSM 6946]
MEHILSLLVFFPAAAGLLGFLVAKESIRAYGISVSAIEFVLSVILWMGFDSANAGYQFVEFYAFIPSYGMSYYLGVDGISLFLVILSTFITMIALIALSIEKDVKNLIISVLFLEMTMVGVFLILDVIWFYAFWELSLVPMLYIIGGWGGEKRMYAAIKFFLYTFAGSVLMLVGILYMGFLYYEATGIWSFALPDWHLLQVPFTTQLWLFGAFFLGFAIKVPMFPFHTWLPYAHGQAPTIGSIILAAVLLKMGSYGFVRFSLPLFPDASVYFLIPVAIICVIMVIYAAMIAYAQDDMKQVIAYSSISHMGIVILGTFAMNAEGITGSIFLMLSHGIVSGALFMLVGVIYDRRHTKLMSQFGGLAQVMPRFATIYGIMLMASVGLPLTIGFVGEFLSLMGFYRVSWVITLFAGTGIILGAVYMLVLYKKSFFGAVVHEENRGLKDLSAKELTALIPLVALVVALGVYPKPLLSTIDMSVQKMLVLMDQKAVEPSTKALLMHANTIGGTH